MSAINVDKLATEIMNSLKSYSEITDQDIHDAIKLVAKQTSEHLKQTSPKRTGAYADSWFRRLNPDQSKDCFSMVVYNKKPHYRLAHLLEYGHSSVDGSFVSARPHIKAAEEKAGEWLDEQLTRKLRG